ncbi:hypothetical protein ACFSSC_05100 [Corynebacterium mendelii]|uniref:Uncharacterized protein n=1 Tax=Corynebacterium mendelii TaxID=2765362 RepID=A0A939DXU6_9CORY|nr:hypothetical protein [Corynebacterium mendelii]MBN9643225.1 hypothetical protein [Corynebacterium mendelii]
MSDSTAATPTPITNLTWFSGHVRELSAAHSDSAGPFTVDAYLLAATDYFGHGKAIIVCDKQDGIGLLDDDTTTLWWPVIAPMTRAGRYLGVPVTITPDTPQPSASVHFPGPVAAVKKAVAKKVPEQDNEDFWRLDDFSNPVDHPTPQLPAHGTDAAAGTAADDDTRPVTGETTADPAENAPANTNGEINGTAADTGRTATDAPEADYGTGDRADDPVDPAVQEAPDSAGPADSPEPVAACSGEDDNDHPDNGTGNADKDDAAREHDTGGADTPAGDTDPGKPDETCACCTAGTDTQHPVTPVSGTGDHDRDNAVESADETSRPAGDDDHRTIDGDAGSAGCGGGTATAFTGGPHGDNAHDTIPAVPGQPTGSPAATAGNPVSDDLRPAAAGAVHPAADPGSTGAPATAGAPEEGSAAHKVELVVRSDGHRMLGLPAPTTTRRATPFQRGYTRGILGSYYRATPFPRLDYLTEDQCRALLAHAGMDPRPLNQSGRGSQLMWWATMLLIFAAVVVLFVEFYVGLAAFMVWALILAHHFITRWSLKKQGKLDRSGATPLVLPPDPSVPVDYTGK